MARINKSGFIWLIVVLLFSCFDSSAKLPFKDKDEFFNYVRNLNPDTLNAAKPLEAYLDPVGGEPTDPVLLKGINLFNSGKIEDAIKYFTKITRNWRKYTSKQRDYAGYQLFHIGYFGMLDPRFNGRPTKMNRNNCFKYGIIILDWEKPSYAILAGLYPLIININIWDTFPIEHYSTWSLKDWDIDLLHSLLKATCQGRDQRNFPFENNSGSNINLNNFINSMQYMGTLSDYMTSNRELPKLQILRKGIELDLAGKHDEAFKYFIKLPEYGPYSDYRNYQCWHIMNFGQTDPYYNGKPSDIARTLRISNLNQVNYLSEWTRYKKYDKKYNMVIAPLTSYLTIKTSLEPSVDAIENYLKPEKDYNWLKTNVYDLKYLNSLISSVCPPGGYNSSVVSNYTLGDFVEYHDIKNDLLRFERGVELEPLLSRMELDQDNLLGIGLTKDQLFVEAAKILPPLPDLKFDKGYEWKEREKLYGKANNYLLRSAIKGNPMAMNTFIIYNLANINTYYHSCSDAASNKQRSEKLKQFIEDLSELTSLKQHKQIIDLYKNMTDEVYAYHKEVYDQEQEQKRRERAERAERIAAEKERKRQERAQLWSGLAMTVLQGVSEGLNTYSQIAAQKQNFNRQQAARGAQSRNKSTQSYSNNSRLSSQQVWNHYLNPQVFMYNYMHGLPTLPNSAQLGLTGSDAYAYDLQNKLQYEAQLNDLAAQKETERLVADGMEKAKKEIQNFSSIYGREPTAQEIQQIYAKYTQGYIDAYTTHVSETVSTNKDLGLGKVGDNKSKTDNSGDEGDSKTKDGKYDKTSTKVPDSTGNDNNKDVEKDNETSYYGEFTRRHVNLYVSSSSNNHTVGFYNCEVYRKGSQYYVKIKDQFYKVLPCLKANYNRMIRYGAKEYYFNF